MIPKIFNKTVFEDLRGELTHFNELNLTSFKRVYFIENMNIDVKRGWQYHIQESKIFFATKGSFKISIRSFLDIHNPEINTLREFILSEEESSFLFVPPKNANMVQSNYQDSKLMVLSDFHLDDSLKDKIRFPPDFFDSFKQ